MRLAVRAAVVAALMLLVTATGASAATPTLGLVVDTNWLPSYIAGTRIVRILQIAGQPLADSPLC